MSSMQKDAVAIKQEEMDEEEKKTEEGVRMLQALRNSAAMTIGSSSGTSAVVKTAEVEAPVVATKTEPATASAVEKPKNSKRSAAKPAPKKDDDE